MQECLGLDSRLRGNDVDYVVRREGYWYYRDITFDDRYFRKFLTDQFLCLNRPGFFFFSRGVGFFPHFEILLQVDTAIRLQGADP